MSAQLFSQGITFGSIFALIALGYHLIYVTTGVLNFALGEQMVIAGLLALTLFEAGLPMPLAIAGAVVTGTVIGVVYERLALAPAARLGAVGAIIASIGVALVLIHGRTLVWGPNPRDFPPFTGVGNQSVDFLGGRWLLQSFWVIGLTALATVGVFAFLHLTAGGRGWRATAQNRTGARLSGINPSLVAVGAVALASAMVTLGGITISPIVLAGGFFGLEFGVKGFFAAILGGFESTIGVIVGGVVVGMLDSFLVGLVSEAWADIALYLLLIVVLLVRPHGLLGRREAAQA